MPFDVTCPECEKSIRVKDEVVDKKIKCPKCGHKFVAKAPEEESFAIAEEKPQSRSKHRSKRRRDDEDEDEDDDDRPRKRKGSHGSEQVPTPMAPMVWGVIAILLPCPIVGFASGGIAIYRANMALGELPEGRRGDSARRNMKIAIGLGAAGCILSAVLSVVMLLIGRS